MGKAMPLFLCHTRIQKHKIIVKPFFVILSILMLLLSCTSCGVFTKIGKHTKHEVQVTTASTTVAQVATETTVKGDSLILIPATTLEATLPVLFDSCIDAIDSVVSDNVSVYLKPVYHVTETGKMVYKGIQVKAITKSQTLKPTYTVTQKTTATICSTNATHVDSVSVEKTINKKHDSRLGGYTTIMVILCLLCVGVFIAKKYYSIKIPFIK